MYIHYHTLIRLNISEDASRVLGVSVCSTFLHVSQRFSTKQQNVNPLEEHSKRQQRDSSTQQKFHRSLRPFRL